MLAYIEIPPELELLDSQSKKISEQMLVPLAGYGTTLHCQNGFDLLSLHPPATLLFIKKGIFKFFYGKKLVRLYETGDVLPLLPDSSATGCRCTGEFSADILVYNREEIMTALARSPEFATLFLQYSSCQARLMHILCALYTNDDTPPDMSFKTFEPGKVIIAEGDPAQEIYMLVQGKALVTVHGVEVGTIGAGEVFGEISFFTSGIRSATVTATSECLVQVMGKEGFLSLIKLKPSVNLEISKLLSQRLIETNRKIADHK